MSIKLKYGNALLSNTNVK